MAHLYRITSPSSKQYIGITSKSVNIRWSIHVAEAKAGSQTALHRAIRKYGAHVFLKEILVIGDYDYVKNLEPKAIEVFGTFTPDGYNLTRGGDGVVGRIVTQEQREAIRVATTKRMLDESQRENLRQKNLGKKMPEDVKKKISESLKKTFQKKPHQSKGVKLSDERKKRISLFLTGNAYTKGKKLSDEHKKKLSDIGKNRVFSDEHRERLSKAQSGRRYSEEVRANMSKAAKLRWEKKREQAAANNSIGFDF
jgi:group I intron endonuclease